MTNIQSKIKELGCCVLIPTYNNEKTLCRVIDGVLAYTDSIIIINDGATDTTAQLLENYTQLEQIHFVSNKGKGAALRAGFIRAQELGYDFAISIDSDGQHYADDIPVFIHALDQAEDKNVLYIGDRNMVQDGIPKNSSFGNKFSSFWYKVETGIALEDTQSGYRLYPLQAISQSKYYTNKFEFEIEVIVKAAWKGVRVENVPVKVLYDPEERVSHFRPIKDFARISVLNTVLVFWTFAYIKPRDFFRKFKSKSFKSFFFDDFLHSNDSKRVKTLSISLGVFIGIAPFWGFQSVLSIALAALFGLNKVISFAFSNVSIPIFIPFIIYGSLKVGAFALGQEMAVPWQVVEQGFAFDAHLYQYVVGSFLLASIMALLFGLVGYLILSIFKFENSKPKI